MMKISAFGDETAVDFEEQLKILQTLNIPCIDVRQAWGVNCSNFTDQHLQSIKDLCKKYDISVACMGSPIGKSPIQAPIEEEADRLKRITDIAHQLGTDNIRLFSFYPEADVTAEAMGHSIQRLQHLTELAESLDAKLLLENEKGLVGDTPARVHQILEAIDSPHLRFIWDPANFVQCGAEKQVDNWWDQFQPYIAYIHIKDATLAGNKVTPAGEGDGQVKELLTQLEAHNYEGILSLEPHLAVAGHSSGFSGADGMGIAVGALRHLMTEVGIQES
jgi:sugar phosphate isomerase/epimerase